MFGLSGEKKGKGKGEEFVFDLEKEMKDLKRHEELREKINGRIEKFKTILREGAKKEEFNKMGIFLHGYTSLLKVINRCALEKK